MTTDITVTRKARVYVVECDVCGEVVTLTPRERTFARSSGTMVLRADLRLCAACTTDLRQHLAT